MNRSFARNLMLHIKYPYTAAVVAVMWIGMAIIISIQQTSESEFLIIITALCSLVVAIIGFASPK